MPFAHGFRSGDQVNSLNAAIISGYVASTPSHKTTNANGWTKTDFVLKSPTKLGEVSILWVAFGTLAEEVINTLSQGTWIVASGTLEGSRPLSSDTLTFALILKSFYPLEVPAEVQQQPDKEN